MNGCLKPLRRKIGVATLVLACILAGLWIRSLSIFDEARVPLGIGTCWWVSSDGRFVIGLSKATESFHFRTFNHRDLRPQDPVKAEAFVQNEISPWVQANDLILTRSENPQEMDMIAFLYSCHLLIAVPLTVLSAWLLLSKPRLGKATTSLPVDSNG